MSPSTPNPPDTGAIQVLLDGKPVRLPPDRRSAAAIRSYLDLLALERQRVLHSFSIDGRRTGLTGTLDWKSAFRRIEGETIRLEQVPQQLIKLALQQTERARAQVHAAVAQVMINDGHMAREFWWELATTLKEPLLALSLLPEAVRAADDGVASARQVCKAHLTQLGSVLRDVDEACWSKDSTLLSNALENHALSWLNSLHSTLSQWCGCAAFLPKNKQPVGRSKT
jgi:hypothetical protein